MAVYYSVRITSRLLCNCKAFKFPHTVGHGLCDAEIPFLFDLDTIPVKVSKKSLEYAKKLVIST